jgi:D-alanyl-D-alanine carboxypeptidase/D-alanyl-D-alanine-endopeptidase
MKRITYLLLLFLFAHIPTFAQVDNDSIEEDDIIQHADSALLNMLVPDSIVRPWPESVQHQLQQLMQSDMLQTSQVGLMVYDLTADSALFAYNERQLMRPASTMKLLTAITAIDHLGGDYQFKTELCYTGKIENRKLTGDIYCVGGFDPRFNTDDLHAFVEAIQKMGIDTIEGRLYADKSMKEAKDFGEGWCWDDKNPVLSPLLISGKDTFMSRFLNALMAANIVVDAPIDEKTKPNDSYCIVNRFHTMDQILMRMLKDSNNLYAESMYYQLAAATGSRPATAKHAREAERVLLRKVGLNPANYRLADGSGLSLYNYLSAEAEVKLLRYAYQNENIFHHLYQALPIAGVDGTLKKRMRSTFTHNNVRAKTGTLTGISSLAGYCKAANGHWLSFAIINQGVMHARNAKNFQNRVCTILCTPN